MINKINLDGVDYEIGGSKAINYGKIYFKEYLFKDGSSEYGFILQSKLKKNKAYLLKYYNDEWGTEVLYFFFYDSDSGEFKGSSNIVTVNNEIEIRLLYFLYYDDYLAGANTNERIDIIKIGPYINYDDFTSALDMDYIEVYELPFTLGSDE